MEIVSEASRSKLPQELLASLQEFLSINKSNEVNELAAHYPQKKSLEVDFVELSKFNPALADELIASPDSFLETADKILASLNPHSLVTLQKYAPHFRIFNLPDVCLVRVQDLGAASLDKLVKVEGVTSWVTDIYPMMKLSVWECEHCWSVVKLATSKVEPIKPPPICKCGRFKFKLLEEKSDFVNLQRARMQELVERLSGGSPTVHVDLWLEDDLTNIVNPGEKLIVCGVLRLKPNKDGKSKSSVYSKFLDALHVYKMQQEFEALEITREEETKIKELALKPNVHELISQSIAPSIYGYKEMKQAIALQLFSGTPGKVLPDGQNIRSDIHTLLIGDPGCLVAGERIALGNGGIVKIETLGKKHLQDINTQVLISEGGKKRDFATCFHKYEKQPVIELILESGKKIAGTYNHPLMAIQSENYAIKRKWKRLDKFKKGDKVQTVTHIPCNIRSKTNLTTAINEFLNNQKTPEKIMQSNNKTLAKFLTWLFEKHGRINSELKSITLKSNLETLRDVQILLLRFSIYSEIKNNQLSIQRKNDIRKFSKKINFKTKKNKNKLEKLIKTIKNTPNVKTCKFEKIIRINKLPSQTVYDIEVPKSHRFTANGIVSHNTAKSSIIQYVMRLAPKAIFTSGKGASSVGLTASAEKDELTGGWILKAGAMVLASGGVIGIDEFDKMEKEDRSALHEAMEQQKISIAKAGIVTTFTARTAVLAAANPKFGRFDPNAPPATQFEIPPTLLSRFDLIFTIKDVIDESKDRKTAEHILLGHTIAAQKLKPAEDSAILPEVDPALLRKYIAYARRNIRPILTNEAAEKVKEYYLDLRQMGKKNNTFPVTARQIEGIIRLSEASAKLRLSNRVELQDAERAIALSNFVLRDVFTDKETGLIDSDIITIGQPKSKIDKIRSILSIIQALEKEFDLVDIDDVVKKSLELNVDEHTTRKHLDELKRIGDLYEPKPGFIKTTRKKDSW